MGFFATLAKKLVGKGDDEALRVLAREVPNPVLPPPKPIGPVPVAPAPAVPLPAPGPINVPITEAPPVMPPSPIAQMEQVSTTLPKPNYSGAYVRDDGAIRGQTYPDRAPAVAAPRSITTSPMDEASIAAPPVISSVPPPVGRVFVGSRTNADMSAAERAGAKVEALQGAGSMSKVRQAPEGYEELPPQKLGRLKAMGKGFLLRMKEGAPYGIGGMLGAGISGTVEGAVAPEHVQTGIRQQELGQAQQAQAVAQQLERGTIANQQAGVNLAADQQQLKNLPVEQERRAVQAELNDWQQQVAQLDKVAADDPQRAGYIAALQTEADRLSKRAGRQITLIPGEGREPLRMAVDGQIVERGSTGWKAVFGSPKANPADRTDENYDEKAQYDWQVKNTENEAKRQAANQAAQMAEETAAEHQKKVSATAAKITALDQQMSAMTGREPEIGPLKRQREQLKQQQASEEAAMNAAYRERNKAKAEASSIPVIPPPPKRVRGSKAGLTIEGAIQRFKELRKREPTPQETANMQAALQN